MRPRASWVVAAALVAAWIGALTVGVDPWTPTPADLIAVGGNYGPRTWAGQWWRLVTAATVHAGVVHLAIDVAALVALGTVLERRLGRAGTAAVLLGATVMASAASLAWSPYDVSAGASGMVAGACGALAVVLALAGHTFTPRARAAAAGAVVATIGWGSWLAATSPTVDHPAHAAGLAAGAALGLALVPSARARGARALAGLTVAVAIAAVIVGRARPPTDVRARAAELIAIEERYDHILDGVGLRADGPRLARTLEREVLGPLRVALARIVVDDRLPPRERRFAEALAAYGAARLRALDLYARNLATGDDSLLPDIAAAQEEARAAGARVDAP